MSGYENLVSLCWNEMFPSFEQNMNLTFDIIHLSLTFGCFHLSYEIFFLHIHQKFIIWDLKLRYQHFYSCITSEKSVGRVTLLWWSNYVIHKWTFRYGCVFSWTMLWLMSLECGPSWNSQLSSTSSFCLGEGSCINLCLCQTWWNMVMGSPKSFIIVCLCYVFSYWCSIYQKFCLTDRCKSNWFLLSVVIPRK